jgi:4-hydroxybenzoate polyprenyltransferase
MKLMRLHRPVGIFLLLWPTYWALWIAGQGHPSLKNVIIFGLGTLIMRSAGCVVNDIADHRFDRQVARTKERPLASGELSPRVAFLLFFALSLCALLLVWQLNRLCLGLALLGLLLTILYPFTKRYVSFPQVVLGAAFAWGIPMAFAAQDNTIPVDAWLLFAATLLWIIVYDTCYAMVDRTDDIKIGIKSTAVWLGTADRLVIGLLQVLFLTLLLGIGSRLKLHSVFYIAWGLAVLLSAYQQYLIKDRDPVRCFKAFMNNQWLGLVVFIGFAYGR